MIKQSEIEERLSKLEGALSNKTYRYCYDTTEILGNMRMNIKTNEIELYDDALPKKNLFILLFPELAMGDFLDGEEIDPFELHYLKYLFDTNSDKNLLIRIKKYQRHIDKEEEARISAINKRCTINQGPKPTVNKPKDVIESKPVAVKPKEKLMQDTNATKRMVDNFYNDRSFVEDSSRYYKIK